MRRFLMVLLLVESASPALADACRLSTEQCSIIAKEIANEQIAEIRDRQTFGLGMLPYPRARTLVLRSTVRTEERQKHLPPKLANEWARMNACDAAENLAAMKGEATPPDPRCK